MKLWFWLLLLSCNAALAQRPDTRTPEQMLVDAYRQLMISPRQVDKRFWSPERWYTRGTISWIADFERCGRGSPSIWHAGQGQPPLTDVDITPVPPIGVEAQVLVSFKDRDRAEQRIFFFRNENGAWRIHDVMATGGRSLNTNQPACR